MSKNTLINGNYMDIRRTIRRANDNTAAQAAIKACLLCRKGASCKYHLWSAPAERSGDGALAHPTPSGNTNAVTRFDEFLINTSL